MKVLIACEFSGIVRDAFTKLGHDAISCDLLPTESLGKHYQGDVFDIVNDGFDLMIAHPPCTYLTCTGNKWFLPQFKDRFPNREQQRMDAIDFFMKLYISNIPKIAIENPIGVMSSNFRKPDQIIQPYQFGHSVNKSTCLWLRNLPKLTPTNIVPRDGYTVYKSGKKANNWHHETGKLPLEDRSRARSKTFQGIADAMASQWNF